MKSSVNRMSTSLERLTAAVDSMHHETVACRRNLMVFRARMDSAEQTVLCLSAKLEKTQDLLGAAEAGARRAAEIFRATAEGRSAA